MARTILITLVAIVPESASDKDINDYIDVELAGVNSMACDNPLIDAFEVIDREWEAE